MTSMYRVNAAEAYTLRSIKNQKTFIEFAAPKGHSRLSVGHCYFRFFHIAMSYAVFSVAARVGIDYLMPCAFALVNLTRARFNSVFTFAFRIILCHVSLLRPLLYAILIHVFAFAVSRNYYLLVTHIMSYRTHTVDVLL